MEEKERYKIHEVCPHLIVDTVSNMVINFKVNNELDLLNQQDKRIKELEEENGYVLFEDGYDENGNEIHKQVYTTYKEEFTKLVLKSKKLKKENQQLKQQLHDLPKKIVGEIKNNCWYGGALLEDNYYKVTNKLLNKILKKYGGKIEAK